MAIDKQTLAAANKYTKKTVEGAGAIKGKNCTIQSIIPMPTIHETEVTFAWYEDGASLPTLSKMMVPDGAQGPQGVQGEAGLGIKSLNIDSNRHLIVTYDDDTTQDAGLIPGGGGPGEIDTELDPTSTNAVENRAIAIPIAALQASMLTKAEQTDISRIDLSISQLQGSLLTKVDKEAGKGLSANDFSDTYKDKLEDLLGIKSAGAGLNFDPTTGELTATGTSIEIDTELDPTSVHPVQNKAIAVPMEALQASMLTKANQSDISRIDLDIAQLQGSLLTKAKQTDINRIDLSISQLQGSLLTKAEQTDINRIDLSISQLQGSLLTKAEQTDINRIDLSISQLQGSLLTKASKSELPTKVSDLNNDSGFVTNTVNNLINYYLKSEVYTKADVDTELDPTSVHPVQNKAIALPIAALQGSMLTKANQSDISRIDLDISALQGSLLTKASKSEVPTKVSELTNDEGFIDSSALPTKVSDLTNDSDYQTASDVATAISGKADKATTLSGYGITDAVNTSQIGSANGVAELGSDGKVPAAQLPSYVDDVEEYATALSFPATGESGKIYVALDTNKTYRWSGSNYVVVGGDLALGETSSTAYAGNKGKANADAIAAIKDGTSIDSFSDVENALSGKQATISDLATIRSGAASGATAYQKPSTGIPKTDLDSAVQTSLGKADTALQSLALGETSSTAYAGNKGKANADAIAAIKDGTSIDSFSDVENALSGKQATISDLSTIRSGASAGATAYQKPSTGIPKADLASAVQTSLGKADTALQSHQSLANYYQTGDTAETDLQDGDYIPFYDASASAKRKTLWSNIKAKLKSYFDGIYSTVRSRQTPTSGGTTLSLVNTGDMYSWNNKQNTISDLSTIRSGAASGATAYQKPSTGIPKTDLTSDVQTSLGKADTALQAHQSLANYYQTGDTAETDLQDGDYVPFYDASASAKRKTLWSNIKAKLKSYFDGIYSTVRSRQTPKSGGTTLSLVNTGDMYSWNNKATVNGHTMSPTPASGLTEATVVSTVKGAAANNAQVPSLYGVQKWTNEKKVRRTISGASKIGSTGIGKWTDKDVSSITTADEADWWPDAAFKIPDNANDIDIDFKFDPTGSLVTVGGYILDTTTGKLCVKFANTVDPATTKFAVDITYTRNEVS